MLSLIKHKKNMQYLCLFLQLVTLPHPSYQQDFNQPRSEKTWAPALAESLRSLAECCCLKRKEDPPLLSAEVPRGVYHTTSMKVPLALRCYHKPVFNSMTLKDTFFFLMSSYLDICSPTARIPSLPDGRKLCKRIKKTYCRNCLVALQNLYIKFHVTELSLGQYYVDIDKNT